MARRFFSSIGNRKVGAIGIGVSAWVCGGSTFSCPRVLQNEGTATSSKELVPLDSVPKHKVVAAAGIVCDARGRALILQRGSTAPWKPLRWNLPGGTIDPGETPEAAALREAWEEVKLVMDNPRPLGAYEFDPQRSPDQFVAFYACQWISGTMRPGMNIGDEVIVLKTPTTDKECSSSIFKTSAISEKNLESLLYKVSGCNHWLSERDITLENPGHAWVYATDLDQYEFVGGVKEALVKMFAIMGNC